MSVSLDMRRLLNFALLLAAAGTLAAQNPAVTISVDASANRHAINPNIYGVAYGDSTTLAQLNVPMNRLGGNNTSRYNWQLNADNRAADWYFESIGYPSAVAGEVARHLHFEQQSGECAGSDHHPDGRLGGEARR